MNYHEAIESVKQGNKVARKSWLEPNGSVMGGKTKMLLFVNGAKAPYRRIGVIDIQPFVAQYIVGGLVSVYIPTDEDKKAKDYQSIEV